MTDTPERKARRIIDANLEAAGWLVQSQDNLDLAAGPGVAVREFPMKPGFGTADYVLYVDRMAIGAIEAKPEGTLTGVEEQSEKYAVGLPDDLPAHHRPLPFVFESNGSRTAFTNGLDPTPRSRHVFNFPRPETLADWSALSTQMRARLRTLPALDESRLWSVQARALRNLEESLGRSDQRALIQMALIPSNFMLSVFKSIVFRKFVSVLNTGSLIQHMFTRQLDEFLFPLPPLPEQEAIAEIVDDQLSVIDALESEIDSKLKKVQGLRQAILRHAFTGRLVPQNPNDEPAAELLKRIAAEREARAREDRTDQQKIPSSRRRRR